MLYIDKCATKISPVTAFVPMKGHSERIPRKNIRSFLGQPLFYQVLCRLEECSWIDKIIINTDCPTIARLSSYFSKVRVVKRPSYLRGDSVPMNDIIAHDLPYAPTEHILQTHATNPLLSLATLENAIRKYFLYLPKFDSLFSVTACRTRFYWPNGKPVNHNPAELLRTQDLPFLFEENSCLYIFSKKSFIAAGNSRIGNSPYMFPMGKIESIDIDYEEDFLMAESCARQQLAASEHAS